MNVRSLFSTSQCGLQLADGIAYDRELQRQGALLKAYFLYIDYPGATLRQRSLNTLLMALEFAHSTALFDYLDKQITKDITYDVSERSIHDWVDELVRFVFPDHGCSQRFLERESTRDKLARLRQHLLLVCPVKTSSYLVDPHLPGVTIPTVIEAFVYRIKLYLEESVVIKGARS